jgi:SAM-dependent methyltransferase
MSKRIPTSLLLAQLTRNLGAIVSNMIILLELAGALQSRVHTRDGAVLDLGAGPKPYEEVYAQYFRTRTSVDVEHSPHDVSGIDVVASADSLPFDSDTFDWVICTEVLEHCANPGEVLSEIRRVLKPGGTCFLTTPFLRPLHEMPFDFYRFTPPALTHLAEAAGLKVISIKQRGEYWAVLLLICLFPVTKFWWFVRKLLRVNVYHPANPLVFLSVVLPQLVYLALWCLFSAGWTRRITRLGSRVFGHYSLGFVTVLER